MPTSRFSRRATSRTGGWRSTTTSHTTRSSSPTGFNKVSCNIQQKIGSYRNIWSQFKGAGTTPFTPTTANKWITMIDNGANVYKFSGDDFSRWFGTQYTRAWSSNMALRHCRQRFGTGIKAVNRGKGNCWLVAATSTVSARPFNMYSWSV